ncbi:MAG: alpha/beta fold hydrolase [Pseudomonadota bacterium]
MTDTPAQESLYAAEQGNSGGAPVVLLHGFGGNARVWADLQPALAPDRLTLAFDLPGHGRSLTAAGSERTGKMAGAVTQDLARRGFDRVHLVGHSMGGAVATLMALRTPRMIASMTLLAPGGFGPEINHRLLRRYANAEDRDALLAALENMFGWNCAIPEWLVDRILAERAQPGAIDGLNRLLDGMLKQRDSALGQGTFGRLDLAELSMPVSVLWGTQDRVLPTRQAHRLPPLFAAHVFEDTGHMLIEERGEAVLHLVRRTIRSAVE